MTTCEKCCGTGELEHARGDESIPCPDCDGEGVVSRHGEDGDPDGEAKYERDESRMLED